MNYDQTIGGGLWHGLKYVVDSASYDRMVAAGLDPLTATDAQLAGYANLYLEYDADRHVTEEATDGGLYVSGFAFTTNANPTYADGYNNWKTKTVESRPDGSVATVYANYVNDVILKQLANGTDTWIEASQFNDRADPLQYAHPSAVVSFDESQCPFGSDAPAGFFCEGRTRTVIQPGKQRAHGGTATGATAPETLLENASMASGC